MSYSRYFNIAIPRLIGSRLTLSAKKKSPISLIPTMSGRISPAARKTAANVIHFICCRSSPRERLKRTIIAAAAETTRRTNEIPMNASPPGRLPSASRPTGLSGSGSPDVESSRDPGKSMMMTVSAPPMTINPRVRRPKRRPGGVPVGYRIGTRRISATAGYHTQR